MKKTNKTYHLQQSTVGRASSSPGRIVKNHNKSLKSKQSHRQNTSTSQSRKQEFEQINKKTEQRLQRLERSEMSKKPDKSQEEGFVTYFGDTKHGMSMESCQTAMREQNQVNPYEQIYHNDLKYFQEYVNSMAKNQFNGINLNWPYYFSNKKPAYT